MKTEIIKFLTFTCMVIVLGTQALLHGSWNVPKTESGKLEQGGRTLNPVLYYLS